MANIPDKAVYRCPEHGLFMVATEGIVWRQRSCTHLVSSLTGRTFPCGILSPLASVNDPGFSDGSSQVGGLNPEETENLRQSIAALRAQREQQKSEGDKPNYMFGGSENRRNGKPLALPAAPAKDVEQELFEAAERERMRAAMNDDWGDSA